MSTMPPPPPPPAGPPAGPPPGYQPHPPQQVIVKQGPGCMKIGLIVLAVLAIGGILIGACTVLVADEAVKELEKETGVAKTSDYQLSDEKCEFEFGTAKATGRIKNTSDEEQGFEVEYRFRSPEGDQLERTSDFTEAIKVNETATFEVIGPIADAPEGTTCELIDVSYHILD